MARKISDDAAQENAKKTINLLSKETKKVGKYLLRVINGTEGDAVFDKSGIPVLDDKGKQIIHKATTQVRVQAARTFRELIFDKVIPDKKHDPKKKDRDANEFAEALRLVADEQKAAALKN